MVLATAKRAARSLTPPIIWATASRLRRGPPPPPPVYDAATWEGPLDTWAEAVAASDGWASAPLLEKTLDLSLKVARGELAAQQDTITLTRPRYSATVLAFIAMAAADGALDVVDFGGSLGTNFDLNAAILRPYLDAGRCIWRVVELPETAALGREHRQTETLHFHDALTDVPKAPGQAIIFTGSLQYVEEFGRVLDEAVARAPGVIAFDRLLTTEDPDHAIYVQRPGSWYPAHLPVRAFSRARFVEEMTSMGYTLAAEFGVDEHRFDHIGLIFTRN